MIHHQPTAVRCGVQVDPFRPLVLLLAVVVVGTVGSLRPAIAIVVVGRGNIAPRALLFGLLVIFFLLAVAAVTLLVIIGLVAIVVVIVIVSVVRAVVVLLLVGLLLGAAVSSHVDVLAVRLRPLLHRLLLLARTQSDMIYVPAVGTRCLPTGAKPAQYGSLPVLIHDLDDDLGCRRSVQLELEVLNSNPLRGHALVSHSLQNCLEGIQRNAEAGVVTPWHLAGGGPRTNSQRLLLPGRRTTWACA
jgi:hypothetical protein